MSANKSDAVIGALLVLLGISVLVTARTFPPSSQLYVNLVSLALIITSAILLAKAVFAQMRLKGGKDRTLSPDKPVIWWFLLANMGFVGAIYLLGFHLAAFLFLTGGTVLLGQKKLITTLLVSGCLVACLYVIFVVLLRVPLPKGAFFG